MGSARQKVKKESKRRRRYLIANLYSFPYHTLTTRATRFGQIFCHFDNIVKYLAFFEGIFRIWQNFEPTLTKNGIEQIIIVEKGHLLNTRSSHLDTLLSTQSSMLYLFFRYCTQWITLTLPLTQELEYRKHLSFIELSYSLSLSQSLFLNHPFVLTTILT